MLSIFLQGLFLQASLILALGAQNIFVLNSGLLRQRHLLVATVSAVCDTFLVFVGVLGVATLFVQNPILKISLGVLGVTFLFYYGILKLKEAKNGVNATNTDQKIKTIKQTIMTTIFFSLLNPHVYLDTVVLIGGYSSRYSTMAERFYFGLGASSFSTLWFFGLTILASFASRLLSNQKAMQIISLISGIILILLSIKLGCDVYQWF